MTNEITITAKAEKQIARLASQYQTAIINAIAQLADFPEVTLDIRKLKGRETANIG